ncbi:MAG: penicillin-binding protein 2 [Actinobacteria bacterium]|nr:penicillin-binding protein 2 [Actinomycetota bacterium]
MSERSSNRRIRLLLGLFALVFVGTLGRAIWLQGVQASTLERIAARQHEQTTAIPAGRGTIYDRTGEPLAIGEQATTVYADPRLVQNPRRVALAAARALGVDAEALYPLLADRKRRFVYVKRKADPAKAAELEREGLAGLGYYSEELRYYPQRGVAAQVLGFAGVDNDGLEGLERSLDKQLLGKPGSQTTVTDPAGRVISVVATEPELPGRDVALTIDHRIQANAESVLRETVKRWGAKAGNVIVLDPRTGAVLAMAVAPGYDANRFASVSPERRRNRSVTDVYEPGSTFKVVTVAAALSEKIVTPTTQFTLASSIRVADRIINEHEPRATQRMTVAQILSQSSNIGTITLAQKLGRGRVESWIDRFGFGRRTGVDAPGESRGLLPGYWSGSTIGNVPIGQGIGVTPVQMAAAYAAIANDGVLRKPYLVARVGDEPNRRGAGRRVISKTVSAQMMAMLRDVVSAEGGTGALAAVPGYTVAGKTGTAAKPIPGGYSDTKYVASFVGVVPAKDPRLVVLVSIDEPSGAIWGGVVAAPAFAEIARSSLVELEIAPDAASGP